jgi:predicted dehydrogenase
MGQNLPSRREFVQSAAAAGTLAAASFVEVGAHAAGSDVLRVGLIGCGGRGTGAAVQTLKADPATRVVALGDAFADRLEHSLNVLKDDEEVASRVDVPPARRFTGFDAYKQVIDSGVDVVLMAAPPHFRPLHIQAAIDAGKHVFAEKPVAVDAPGLRKVLAACQQAKAKNLAVVSGLCWRYSSIARASIQKVHGGAIGDIVALQSCYNIGLPGKPWPMVKKPGWSDMEWQLRNWYWWTWLSGDHIVEQAIHQIDLAQWANRDQPPVAATGLGGLQARTGTGPERAQIFDHHAVVYEYANGLKHFHSCRQQTGCHREVATYVFGTTGTCHIERGEIRDRAGNIVWRFDGKKNVMHQAEHDEMYAGIRSGKLINDAEFMCTSNLVAILGRMATYTGQNVTWDQALNSKEDLTPPRYEWGQLDVPKVAVPGVTRVG